MTAGPAIPPRNRKPIKSLEFTTTRQTRSQTLQRRREEEREKLATANRREAALRKAREEALRNKAAAPEGSRRDGNFHMAFVQMGQGDCCIVTTPLGRIVMVDCGTDSREEENVGLFVDRVRSVLYGKKFLKGSNTIDVVILTHPDTDHYNHFQQVLNDGTKLVAVYHSAPRSWYSEGQTSNWLLERVGQDQQIRRVEHHQNDDRTTIALDGMPVAAATETEVVDRLDGNGGIRVLDEDNCKISILAGGVTINYQNDNSNITNRGSLVTLIEVFGKKILLHGDATRSTEHYLLRKHKDRIGQVTLATAGHHGSNRTSSLAAYVRQVAPELVVISAGKRVPKDHLPSEEVIDRYIANLGRGATISSHEIFFWRAGGMGSFYHASKFIVLPVYVTGSWETFYYTLKKPA
jgi:beta-lactamase superfamily II metal-dependent hydrolase